MKNITCFINEKLKKLLLPFALIDCLLLVIVMLFSGCTTEADRVNYNITKDAENFNVYRRITVINCIKGDVLFTAEGLMNIKADTTDNQLELIVETEDGKYEKHFIGLSDNVTYTVQDITGNDVNKYKFVIHYNPNMWIPFDVEYSD